MRLRHGFYFLLLVFLSFCTKQNDGPSGIGDFLRVTIDGEQFEARFPFATTNTFTGLNGEPGYTLSVLGDSGPNNEVINVAISNVESMPTVGEYTSVGELQNFNNIVFLLRVIGDDSWESGVDNTQATVEFTELNYESGGRVRGTFSGSLINEEDGEKVIFENGEFSVRVE